MSITEKEEVELLYALKQLPDFECWPIPASWYEKYKLAPCGVINPREFMASNYAMEIAMKPKDLPPLIIDEPQQDGKLVQFIDEPPPHVELRSRPFDHDPSKPFPAVLVKEDDPIVQGPTGLTLPTTASLHRMSSSPPCGEHQDQQGDQETGSSVQGPTGPSEPAAHETA